MELFGQSPGGSDLVRMGQRKFGDLAELYDVGTRVKVSGGDVRAVELTSEFLAFLFGQPVTDEEDGRTQGHTHAKETASAKVEK